MFRKTRPLIAALAAAWMPLGASAVYLNADGLGQALVYPYYTTRTAPGGSFNTYVSAVNHTSDAKVVRVRFREARNGRVAQGFNLYLGPNDMWTGAIVPLAAPEGATRIVTADTSCVNAPFDTTEPGMPGRTFQNFFYAGSNSDGLGEGLDRTREGWIEMIEMATLTGASAAAVRHNASGVPANCAAVQGDPALSVAPPTGGLSGTVTMINVANGQDFAVNAEALAQVSTQPFYRQPADSYPGFDAAEVNPISVVTAEGSVYRSLWSRGIDAVSASLMRREYFAEYVLDAITRSQTEIVVVFPTRHFYVIGTSAQAPFAPFRELGITAFNREERANPALCTDPSPVPCGGIAYAGSVTSISFSDGSTHTLLSPGIFGSMSRPVFTGVFVGTAEGAVVIPTGLHNGWVTLTTFSVPLVSLPTSTRLDIATGQVATGSHTYQGLPVVGFGVRTFENGTLTCGFSTCQGNYGAAFPLKYRRAITLP